VSGLSLVCSAVWCDAIGVRSGGDIDCAEDDINVSPVYLCSFAAVEVVTAMQICS